MLDINAFSGLDVVYHDAGEREIRAVNVYANTSKLYTDAEHATEIAHDLALELCEKGFLRVIDTNTNTLYTVTSFKDSSGTLTVGYGASKTATVTDPSL